MFLNQLLAAAAADEAGVKLDKRRRPKDPGVYYIKNDIKRLHPSLREVEGWDIVELRFSAGGWGNESQNREDMAHWRVSTLSGIDRAWHKGMWLKGPISPFGVTP